MTLTVGMTDSQLGNNNRNISSNNSNNNRNNIANVNSTGSNNSSSINNVIINSNTSIINNNNYNSSNNNRKNHYEEPRYLHKKFKKIATTEVIDTVVNESVSQALQTKDSFFNLVSTNIIELNESCKSGYICPYCKLSCAKPSVLQKHIRAHTNERPYPCIRCGFAFKTKSNFYKHCKSRAHAIKMEGDDVIKVLQTTLQHSEDSDLSHSDSASNDASSPPPLLSSLQPPLVSTSSLKSLTVDSNAIISHKTAKIYKPKFHTALQQCTDTETTSKTNIDFLKDHIECVINDSRNIVPSVNPHLFKLLHAQKDPHRPDIFRKRSYELNTKKSYYPTIDAEVEFNNKCKLKSEFNSKSELDCYNTNQQSLDSPGPVLGHTSLISVQKRPKLDELSSYSRPSALQMFGGEVRILDHSGESKTLRIEPCSSRASKAISFTSMSSVSGSETASVLVRSSLHSGGTILQKPAIENVLRSWNSDHSFTRLTPNISPPCLAPSLGVLHISETHSFSIHLSESDKETIKATVNASTVENKFIRPSSLSLKPISFATNCHLGITSTANTVTLISPETPRSKKSYGQLYLNGHAYTYLGLKCSTRLFYCTLNRPQPMYVTQQNGLSMYSNWKICKEAPSELELAQYDSRHRPTGYTLACSHYGDILTHSSQRPYELKSFDSSLESDSQEKVQKFQLVNNESENIENYTCIHTKNKTKRHENEQQFNDILMNVYKEEAISCKKTSKFKKHIPVHMNNQPFRCALCAFNFKTKNNMNKHMKSKAHSKKCIESRVLFDGNSTEMDCLISTDDSSTSEDDSEIDAEAASDESGGEEREAARGLLSLGRPITFQLPGLLPSSRPVTYPYSHTAKSQELDELAVPIDLSIRQSNEPVIELASLASVTSLVADFPGRGAGTNTVQIPLGLDIIPRKVVVGGPAFHINTPSTIGIPNFTSITEDARSICGICNKVFSKPSQLRLHINIHYFERPFKCESCGTSFRTKGHLTKHERSTIHHNKVSMTSTFGAATASNPRPFKCTDCKSAFRIHGHLAKHLRSKMHIMKLECLRKLPFGTYAEIERSGVNLNDIDTNDCDTSLTSLRIIAQKLFEKDPSKLEQWEIRMLPIGDGDSTSDEGENNPVQSITQCTNAHLSQNYYMTMCSQSNEINITERRLNETIRIKLK